MKSSMHGELDTTRFLVECKANLETTDNRYYTPTTLFFKSRAPLQFGSIFLISVISGDTALMWSSWNGKLDVTRFLLESKANLEATDKLYYTLQHDFSNRAHRCSSVQFF
jgi:ankyrin repeat protein